MAFLRTLPLAVFLAFTPAFAADPVCAPCQPEPFKPSPYPAKMIPLGVELNDETLAPFEAKLDERVEAGDKVILVRIDSPGGAVDSMWHLVQKMEAIQARHVKINCVVDVEAASGAFDVLQGCDERLATDRAVLLSHMASTQMRGTREELKDRLAWLERMDDARLRREAKRLGMPFEDLLSHVRAHDWSLSAEEALAYHAIDAVVDPRGLPPPYELDKPKEPENFLERLLK